MMATVYRPPNARSACRTALSAGRGAVILAALVSLAGCSPYGSSSSSDGDPLVIVAFVLMGIGLVIVLVAVSMSMSQQQNKGIFISYRRDDAPGDARHISDKVIAAFGRKRVFFDVSSIDLGLNFESVLDAKLQKCFIGIVVIGPRFVEELAKVQAEGSTDYLTKEVSVFLQRDIYVVPVLVNDAQLPSASELPKELQGLVNYQAIDIRHAHFDADVRTLIQKLKQLDARPLPK